MVVWEIIAAVATLACLTTIIVRGLFGPNDFPELSTNQTINPQQQQQQWGPQQQQRQQPLQQQQRQQPLQQQRQQPNHLRYRNRIMNQQPQQQQMEGPIKPDCLTINRRKVFLAQNEGKARNVIDLHGLSCEEAVEVVEECIDVLRGENFHQVDLITGRGRRSEDGVAKIKNAIHRWLCNNNIRFEMPNKGMFRANL